MKLEMTMTFGDLLVTAGTIVAIVIAYYAIKGALATITVSLKDVTERVAEHDDTLVLHGEGLAALDASVFGRRRQDPNRARDDRGKRRPIIEGDRS